MNIVRKIHDLFRVKALAGSTLPSPTSTSDSTRSGNTYITVTGGSLGGGGLSEADRSKLNSIEQGAQVNQDAFSKVILETANTGLEQLTTTSNSIIANIPSDTANIKLVGKYPVKISLESVSLFNYNTVTTTGDIAASYNVSYNEDGNIVIDYVSGTLFSATDIEIIRIQHREETLATYNNTQFEYTESEGTITQFIIPYQGTDFSSILFCRYETNSTESTEGTETVRELSVITELPVSPTKQLIITLSDTNANYWKYEEDENGNRYLWTDCNVYSTKELSAYGKAAEQETPTILNLSQLQDVLLTNLANNLVLVYSSSSLKWVNVDVNSLGILADNLKTLTITVNGTSYTYNPATSNQSISITTITLDDILPYISNKLDREEFFKWFTINYDSNNNVTSILANYDFYSIRGISAYGLGDMGSTTRTTLSSLDDVNLSNLTVDNMLAYNGSKWVNIPMSQVRGVTSWADLENKPTTISGFGITDAYTKTEVNTKISEVSSKVTELSSSKADATIQVIAGDGLTGGGNLQQDITIALLNLNSTGTYYKVNVDTYGRVVSGISYLTIDDILNLLTQLDSKLNVSDFNTWFTIIYNTDGTIKNIRANYDFYSVGAVSAFGIGDEEKKTYTTLAELNDVQLTNTKATDVLVYNGTKWVNVDQSTIRGITSWADLENKPTTISGFGIVDAYTKTEIDNKLSPINSSITSINSSINTINTNISDLSSSLSGVSTKLNNFLEGSDTDTIINKWKELEAFLAGYTQTLTLADLLSVKANSSILIIAGTGLVGGGDLTANRTISLSTSGVSAGTYTKVTVDTYGRVTSGNTLSATDIPDLDWSKITSGKPTTLEGYGITDGVNNITFTGSGNAITAVTISNHLLTFTKGETFLPKSTFDDLFEKVNVGTTSNPVYAIKAKYHLYSVGEVSAYEFGEAGGAGASSLEELIDVQLTNLVADSILKYNGTKWVNIPITEVKGATSWNEIEDKPSTFTPSAHTHTIADITDISTKYVSISTALTVSGLKTFTSTVKYLPTYYSCNAEDIEYRTASGTLFGGIGAVHNGSSISYFYIGKGSTPWDTKDGLTIGDELGFKGHTVWHSGNAIIPTVPTKLSAFKNDSGYLTAITKAQVEGVLTGDITSHTHSFASLTSKPTTAVGYGIADAIYFTDNTNYTAARFATQAIANRAASTYIEWWQSGAGFFSHKAAKYIVSGGTSSQFLKGDGSLDSTAYLPLRGGKLSSDIATKVLTLNSNVANAGTYLCLEYLGSKVAEFGHGYGLDTYMWCNSHVLRITSNGTAYADSNILIHSSNYNSYSPTLTGAGASGTWGISITGNAATASNADTVDDYHASNLTKFYLSPMETSAPASSAISWFTNSMPSGAGAIVYNVPGSEKTIIVGKSTGLYGHMLMIGYDDNYLRLLRFQNNKWLTDDWEKISAGYADNAGNADTLDGYHAITESEGKCFGTIPVIKSDGVTELGHYIDWHYDNTTTSDFSTRLEVSGNHGNAVTLPSASGTLALLTDNVASATKLQTARTLWGQSFDGTSDVNGPIRVYYKSADWGNWNEGIRLYGSAKDGTWSNIHFGCDPSATVGSHANQWMIGRNHLNQFGIFHGTDNTTGVIHIDANNNVGIGTNSPAYKLDVSGNVRSTQVIFGYMYGTNSNAAAFMWDKPGSNYTGVGSDGTVDTIRFSACNEYGTWVSYTQNWKFYGNIAATGAVTAKASSSDIRLKTDITDYKALSIIRSHKSIKYHWNAVAKANADIFNDDYWHYGLIAQDVQRDMPQMVSDVFKDYLVINYERLIPICWKGLQEVDDEVTKLKKRVKQLEKRLLKYESTEVFYTKGND